MMTRWLLTKGRLPYLVLLALWTGWLGWNAAQVGVDADSKALNTREPTEIATYDRFKQNFGNDEDLLVALTHPHLLEQRGLAVVADLSDRIEALDGVRHVFALTNLVELAPSDLGPQPVPLVPLRWLSSIRHAANNQADSTLDSNRLLETLDRNPGYTGLFVSADRRTTGIVIEIEDREQDTSYRSHLISSVRSLLEEVSTIPDVETMLTGIGVQKHDVSAYVDHDRKTLIPFAALLQGLVLLLLFRSVVGVVLPLAVTAVTTISTIGFYHLAGLELNPITALLPPVLMVVSLAVSVHLVEGWRQESTQPGGRIGRIETATRRLVFPAFFCALTTAMGFLSLMTSDLAAVSQFGLFAALGVAISFAVGMTLVPVGLSFVEATRADSSPVFHRWMQSFLAGCSHLAIHRPRAVLVISTLLTLLAASFIPSIRNNTDLVRFLDEDSALRRDTLSIDNRLTGANALEFMISKRDGGSLGSLDTVQRLSRFELASRAHPEVATVVSILPVLRQIQRAERPHSKVDLPADEENALAAFDLLEAAPDQPLVGKFLTSDLANTRVSVRIHSVGTATAAPLAAGLLDQARQIFGDAYRVEETGSFYHVVEDSNRLVRQQVVSFAVALVLVSIAIGAVFRSFRITLLALVPNLVPIAWSGGLMGAFGIDLSSGTAMIASVVMGLVVDGTIHYVEHFRKNYAEDAATTIRHTTARIGPALLISNIVLALGFWVGCLGSFKPTIYFSLFSGLTMLSALLCDLLITPSILLLLDYRPSRAS